MARIVATLRLVRFPLVWTALADGLAGAALAAGAHEEFHWGAVGPLLLISPGLYLFGMALNDISDAEADRRRGRDRPIAQGELSIRGAVLAAVFLLGLTIIGTSRVNPAAMAMVAATLGCIVLYNLAAKRWIVTAVPVMVGCRIGNVLVGWTAVAGQWPHDLAGPVLALLIAVGTLTATASLVSQLEKTGRLNRLAGLRPEGLVLAALLLLPVADGACVALAWADPRWAIAWASAVPMVWAGSWLLKRRCSVSHRNRERPGD